MRAHLAGPCRLGRDYQLPSRVWDDWRASPDQQEHIMSKRARKRRARKGKGANHGHRPNA